jgi:hypothetical protein
MTDLDSTQTVRAIPLDELYDSHRQKWHVIQLVVSDKPVNLDMMPRLEVFAAHRLYAVAGKHADGTRYALRLGFFPDEQSAEVVCEHLRTFFSEPSIVRVSAAEHARFAQPATPRAAVVARPAPVPAAEPAIPRQSEVVAEQPLPANKSGKTQPPVTASGTQKRGKRTKTLREQLLDEAREVQLSRSGKHRIAEQSGSWLTRLLGGPKR